MKIPQQTYSSHVDLYSCPLRAGFVTSCPGYLMIDACEGNISERFLGIFGLYSEDGDIGFEEFQHGFEQRRIRKDRWNISPMCRRHRLWLSIQRISNGYILKLSQYVIGPYQLTHIFVTQL